MQQIILFFRTKTAKNNSRLFSKVSTRKQIKSLKYLLTTLIFIILLKYGCYEKQNSCLKTLFLIL